MVRQSLIKFCPLFVATLVLGFLNNSCQAAKKTLMNRIEDTTHDGVYSLFNMVFSRNGTWVLLGLAVFVAYLFWRKS